MDYPSPFAYFPILSPLLFLLFYRLRRRPDSILGLSFRVYEVTALFVLQIVSLKMFRMLNLNWTQNDPFDKRCQPLPSPWNGGAVLTFRDLYDM